ncbi:hypothetical protein [Haematomicrobium sanguinis]|uniref:hypothetical protein n=1 Tax=Haematomicrobium sanguinis TaxID=479106 RepID=UPI000A7A3D0F|nr:hypothetical protein [Haematomicrobium sanguinis]
MADNSEPRDNPRRPARSGPQRSTGGRTPRRDDRSGEGRRRASDGERKPFRKNDGDKSPYARKRTEGAGKPRREGQGAGRREGGFRPREDRGPRPEREARPVPERNPSDLRSANRADRGRSPDIDEDVTGGELDRVTTAQVNNLEDHSAKWVAKHLVMAARVIEDDPELAFQHTLAASRRGGRLAVVREAVGIAAYQAGHYAEALRELRTHRRISGSQVHLPLIADAERGNGKPEKALEIARSAEVAELDTAGKVEMSMVESGARADLGQFEAAVSALETPYLDKNKAFSYSPRLFSAYADALEAAGRGDEADSWRLQARRAEEALGIGDFAEPEIIDLVPDHDKPEQPERSERAKKFDRGRDAGRGGRNEHGGRGDRAERKPRSEKTLPEKPVPENSLSETGATVEDTPREEPEAKTDAPEA